MGFFYTGKGDAGASNIGKQKVPKDSPILEALGDMDELNSLLGLIRAHCKEENALQGNIKEVQEVLFIVQAQLAWLMYPKFEAPALGQEKITFLEEAIERIEKEIDPERGFIVTGGEPTAAWLDYARAVSRRAERRVVALAKEHEIAEEVMTYLNRLSSFLYALAREQAFLHNTKESHPRYQ